MMQTVVTLSTCTTVVNRSKFLTYIIPIEEFKDLQKKLKLEIEKFKEEKGL